MTIQFYNYDRLVLQHASSCAHPGFTSHAGRSMFGVLRLEACKKERPYLENLQWDSSLVPGRKSCMHGS